MFHIDDDQITQMSKQAKFLAAKTRNAENSNTFAKPKDHTAVQDLYDRVVEIFRDSRVFINFNQKTMTVKVEKPTRGNMLNVSNEFNNYIANNNVVMKTVGKSLIFHKRYTAK